MIDIETVRNLGNGHFVIPVWEVVFYVFVITVFALMGRSKSCLINTYAFTLYWGFMSMLPGSFTTNGLSQTALNLYIVCGLAIYCFMSVAFLQSAPRGKAFRGNS